MSSGPEPEGIYVYQPFGPSDPEKRKTKRYYGLGGLPLGARCDGLTKDEAEVFAETLNEICWMSIQCVYCGHRHRFATSDCAQCGKKTAPPWVEPNGGTDAKS